MYRQMALAREDCDAGPCDAVHVTVLRPAVFKHVHTLVTEESIRSLQLWSLVASAARETGLGQVYSGTILTEALWAHMRAVLGSPSQTTIRGDLWDTMTAMLFHRFVFQRAAKETFPKRAKGDPQLAEQLLSLQEEFRTDRASVHALVEAWWAEG